ncbi:MAG TPA: hypothetical protein VMR43_11800 [Variovorax sp.]|nr:hypothetical protein [Variovorax sp.]
MTHLIDRRQILRGAGALAALALGGCATTTPARTGDVFDVHCHIIDPRYPLVVNQGYTPPDVDDAEIASLAAIGVRALRFDIFRGRVDSVDDVVALGTRAHRVGGWHAEIYADAAALRSHVAKLSKLPRIVIDHLGMTEEGLPVVPDLVDAGARIKATGFGRVTMDVPRALARVAERSPDARMFGTDLPSTRVRRALWRDAVALYRTKI